MAVGREKSLSSLGRGSGDPAWRKTWLGFSHTGEKAPRPRGGAWVLPGTQRLLSERRSMRTWKAAPGADHGGLPGEPGPHVAVLSWGVPVGLEHPGEGPAHCFLSQNVCQAWEFTS